VYSTLARLLILTHHDTHDMMRDTLGVSSACTYHQAQVPSARRATQLQSLQALVQMPAVSSGRHSMTVQLLVESAPPPPARHESSSPHWAITACCDLKTYLVPNNRAVEIAKS